MAVAADLDGDGIFNDAPAAVPDANADGMCDKHDLKAFGLASDTEKSAVLHQSPSRPAPPNPAASGRPRFRNGSRAGLCAGLPPSRGASCCSHPQTVVRYGPLEVLRIGYRLGSTIERSHGLKPNYQYEKRQREMEKKKKKAEKEQKKAASTETPPAETPPAAETAVPPADK